MSTTNLNIRIDKDVKEQAEQIFAELGLNMTTAINLFLRTAIRKHGIPFDLLLDVPNETTVAAIVSTFDHATSDVCLPNTLSCIKPSAEPDII
jgi:DNA-damage-inducible protein J